MKKLVGVILTMLALVAATPAQAQADDRFGAAFSFLRWDGDTGAPGFLVDYSKQLVTQQNMATTVFGELSLHRWGGVFPETDIFVHGGVRQYFMTDNPTVQPFAHFMVGFLRWSDEDFSGTDPTIGFGFGAEIKATDKIKVKAQYDRILERDAPDWDGLNRFSFGVVVNVGGTK